MDNCSDSVSSELMEANTSRYSHSLMKLASANVGSTNIPAAA